MTDHVITLIAETLDIDLMEDLGAALHRLGAAVGYPRWLAPDAACDLDFTDLDPDQADAAARLLIGGRKIDVVAQPAADRRKRLLVADMESTLIENEMLDELADFVGLHDEIAGITARAMNGELDFESALEARVKLLTGMKIAVLKAAAKRIRLMPGARPLIATMRAAGARTVLVSGGFRFFTRQVASMLGMDAEFANDLDIAKGKLAGTVARPILGRQAKFDTLVREAAHAGLPLAATLAVGDGANDLDLIMAAGLGIAYHAKPIVAARARWRIEHGDLSALLYAQGYRADEIVAG
jgi:phosphoserine phosphatase